ncbi:hypothetical protein Golax_018659 [Gossypium laxum]|uniref:CASP-like protein n=1 Tax=Gossypium laxum TaxID=34288 RepID=A0A7J8Z3X1_9ROSI|nr:hypothetical protein [Gossypium laxum]
MCLDAEFSGGMRAVQSAENFQNKMAMEGVPGLLGTSVGFSLRIGQTLFSSDFSSCHWEWSSTAILLSGMSSMLDGYSVVVKCPVRQPGKLFIIAAGDWVLSVLTLAAACSTASVVDLLFQTSGSFCTPKCCSRYQLSAAMAFLTWFLSLASALLNLWLLPSS